MSLPRIVRFNGTDDGGDGATCPHCGARGRWIVSFTLEDGSRRSAMRGCVKLFPVSEVAREEMRLQEKAKRYAKNGWSLNRADSMAVEDIERFYRGELDERSALASVKRAKFVNVNRYHGVRA